MRSSTQGALSGNSGDPVTIAVIRAHEPSSGVLRLYDQVVEAVGPENALIVNDEVTARRSTWPSRLNRVPLTAPLLERLGLRRDIPKLGWRCGDYAYYAAAEALSFDFVWLLESDVGFYGLTAGDLIDRLRGDDSDFVTHRISRVAEEEWHWATTLTSRGILDVWRTFFPLTRASSTAVDASLQLRFATQYLSGVETPNDEVVVATAVGSAGLSTTELSLLWPDMFQFFGFFPRKMHSGTMERRFPAPQIFHPVLDQEDYLDYLRHCMSVAESQSPLRVIREVARRILDLEKEDVWLIESVIPRRYRIMPHFERWIREYDTRRRKPAKEGELGAF